MLQMYFSNELASTRQFLAARRQVSSLFSSLSTACFANSHQTQKKL